MIGSLQVEDQKKTHKYALWTTVDQDPEIKTGFKPTWQHQAAVNPEIHILLTQDKFWGMREIFIPSTGQTGSETSVYVNW